MILCSAAGCQQEVRDLLEKSMVNMTGRQVQAWMDWIFDPDHMYLYVKDGKVISCLQVQEAVLTLGSRHMEVVLPVLFCTHPDYRLQRYFGRLLDAALARSSVNQMMMLAVTDQVRLLEKRAFHTVARFREYWMPADAVQEQTDAGIYPWRTSEDLYPVYCRFIRNFPNHIRLGRTAFEKRIRYAYACRKQIWTAYGPGQELEGFCIGQVYKDQVKLETIVYTNSRALGGMLFRAAARKDLVTVITGPNEALDRLVPAASWRPKDSIMVRLSSWKHLSKWLETDIHTGVELFDAFYAPFWMMAGR